MNILVAEDDPTSQTLLRSHLKHWGYEPIIVPDGQAAWDILQAPNPPQLALLDWMMPGIDGIELCRRIRAIPSAHYTYIIMVTAKSNPQNIIEGLEAGADDYIVKPFDGQELVSRIKGGLRVLDYERTLIQTQQQMAFSQHMASVGLMTAGVAHEINQPLNALKITVDGMCYQLGDGQQIDPSTLLTKLQRISEQATRIDKIISHMRTLSASSATPDTSPTSVADALDNVLRMLGNQLANNHIAVEIDVAANVQTVMADSIQLEQILTNLIVNAMHALQTITRHDKTIRIGCRRTADETTLTLGDNGPGLGDKTNTIFDGIMPHHAEETRMGIGLKIVRNFIASWGGRITAQNLPSGGAQFTVTLKNGPSL